MSNFVQGEVESMASEPLPLSKRLMQKESVRKCGGKCAAFEVPNKNSTSDTERGIEANFRAKRVERAAGRQGKAKGSIKRAEKPGVVQSKQNVVVVVSANYTSMKQFPDEVKG